MKTTRLTFEAPYGCRWCGVEKHRHDRRWAAIIQMHSWMEPDQATILDRMRRRRAHRLAGVPAVYHATTGWTGTERDPEDPGYEMCADCRSTQCPRWLRVQRKLDRQRWRQALAEATPYTVGSGGWGGEAFWPF